jgi:hypothetical protein
MIFYRCGSPRYVKRAGALGSMFCESSEPLKFCGRSAF